MPIESDFIRAFLERWESRRTVAYIPCRKRNFTGENKLEDCGEVIGASGVTVATGLDLGQQREADLRRMGLSEPLIEIFRPYLGKRKNEAVAALSAAPFALSDEDCDAVNKAVHDDYIRRLAALYNAHTTLNGHSFESCPCQAQAVLVSLFYQLGDGRRKYPRTWELLCAADWDGAAEELLNAFSKYTARRKEEGELLRGIASQKL